MTREEVLELVVYSPTMETKRVIEIINQIYDNIEEKDEMLW